jgi:hypothetical protein
VSAADELLLSIRDRESMEVRCVLDEFACVEAAFQLGGFRVRLNDSDECPVLLFFCPSRELTPGEVATATVLMAYAMECMKGLERLASRSYSPDELRFFLNEVQNEVAARIDAKRDWVKGGAPD